MMTALSTKCLAKVKGILNSCSRSDKTVVERGTTGDLRQHVCAVSGIKEWILHKGMDFEIIIKYRKTVGDLPVFL